MLDDLVARNDMVNSKLFNIVVTVKSFFKWNRRDLARACGNVTLQKTKPYNALSKEVLRKLYDRALNPRDRALITFVTSTAIAKETLSKLKWSHLEANWENIDTPAIILDSSLLKGHGIGKYQNVKQITFLTPEAKRELKNYKEYMEDKLGRKLGPADHIWISIYRDSEKATYEPLRYDALGMHVTKMAKAAGVKFSLHDGRRWVNTALEQIGISQNWARKIRGRKVKGEEAPYSQPAIEQLREKFRQAVPLLEFTGTTEKPLPKEVQDQIDELRAKQRQIEQQYGVRFRQSSKRKQKTRACNDGKHCQQVIVEEKLDEMLAAGWTFVATLPSGKIVVSNEE